FRRSASRARSVQAETIVLVMVGTTTRGTTKKTIASAPPYKESRRSSPSTSSCRKAGGNSPRNSPQQPIIQATCSLLVKLSRVDIHHRQAAQPTTPRSSQTSRNARGRYRVVRKVETAIVSVAGARIQPATSRG